MTTSRGNPTHATVLKIYNLELSRVMCSTDCIQKTIYYIKDNYLYFYRWSFTILRYNDLIIQCNQQMHTFSCERTELVDLCYLLTEQHRETSIGRERSVVRMR